MKFLEGMGDFEKAQSFVLVWGFLSTIEEIGQLFYM